MSQFEIPLSPTPQKFSISLANVLYTLTLKWNPAAGVWVMDIADDSDTPIVNGIPLVSGSDLLEQYAYLGIDGAMYAETEGSLLPPTYANLGITGHLYFVPNG